MNIDKLYKEFKKEHPETIGEKNKCFDQDNYKDWLEIQVMKLRDTKQVNDANTSDEKCTLHNVSHLLPSDKEITQRAIEINSFPNKCFPNDTIEKVAQGQFKVGANWVIEYIINNNG